MENPRRWVAPFYRLGSQDGWWGKSDWRTITHLSASDSGCNVVSYHTVKCSLSSLSTPPLWNALFQTMDQNKLLLSLSYFYPEFCHRKRKTTNSTIPLPGAETISRSSGEPCVRQKRVLKAVLSGESPRYF